MVFLDFSDFHRNACHHPDSRNPVFVQSAEKRLAFYDTAHLPLDERHYRRILQRYLLNADVAEKA